MSKEAVQDSVIDMYLLTNTDIKTGFTKSSFCEMCCILSQYEKEDV